MSRPAVARELCFDGFGAAQRDVYHEKKRQRNAALTTWSAAAGEGEEHTFMHADEAAPVGPPRYANALEPVARTRDADGGEGGRLQAVRADGASAASLVGAAVAVRASGARDDGAAAQLAPAGGGAQPSAAAEQLARLLAEDAAEAGSEERHGTRLQRAVAAINELPLPDVADVNASYKLRAALQVVTHVWNLYLKERPTLAARLEAEGAASTGPSWRETVGWARWLLTTRLRRSRADTELQGRTRDTAEVYLKHAMGHVWRALYPAMQQMPKGEWSG